MKCSWPPHLPSSCQRSFWLPPKVEICYFLGFLLPLLESGNCTLREAIIVGSVIGRNSIPILHSSAVMLKIAEMEYGGSNSIFLRIFFDKKYILPYWVVDTVVFQFFEISWGNQIPFGIKLLWLLFKDTKATFAH